MKDFEETFAYRLIYIFAINDKSHRGLLKIGDTSFKTNAKIEKLLPNSEILNQFARKRINQFTNTAGISYELKYTELINFRDYQVHDVLKNSGIKPKKIDNTTGREWFKISLKNAVAAIQAVKHNKKNLSGVNFNKFIPVIFRPEQKSAIDSTVKIFKTNNKMLWNAKMRFGKTLCALQVVKLMNFSKTIIITHRPVVSKNWYTDFDKIFGDRNNFIYGSKQSNDIDFLIESGKNFVYFASIQDLRGSETVGGKFNKNEIIFSTDWDFVIVDEAHEGTQTVLGDSVIKNIVKKKSKFLALSGTPFNILHDFEENIFTWDYVMEQQAKKFFDENNFGDSNPYEDLPKMNICTYNIGDMLKTQDYFSADDKSFNFREFFRTDDDFNFVHKNHVQNFLCLLSKRNSHNKYPFSCDKYRQLFKHTLWIIPGVKEGRALEILLKNHPVFCTFKIVNVAGGDDNALKKVEDAIKNFEYTITLSCGKLTAGVTIPEWTAVFMLAGSFSTSAANYMQTIFRVQTPYQNNNFVKKNCYVFDFAPDRTLKMIAEFISVSTRAGQTSDDDRKIFAEIKNFLPIIAVEGSEMKPLNTNNFFQLLKNAYAQRVVKNGFDDSRLYNDNLLKLDELDLKKFAHLKKIIGSSNSQAKIKNIVVNAQGFTNEEFENNSEHKKISPEQKILIEQKKRRINAIKILRQISIRMPLLIYGSDIPFDEDFTIDMFLDIDDDSWTEFMPKGVTKDNFKDFIQYYDQDIFIQAGRNVRLKAKNADYLKPTQRIAEIAKLFNTFKNPDKETVLTSWNVVNLHISKTLGGYNFFADNNPPQFVDSDIFNNINAKILEINSKTGLYPLYAAYSFYRARLNFNSEDDYSLEELQIFWDAAVRKNIFVLCKTPMAQKITQRTLAGFRNSKVNSLYFENIPHLLKFSPDKFISNITKGFDVMKFDAVIGNPPYQNITDGNNNFASPIYNYFIESSQKLADVVTLIHPARFLFNAGATPKDFNKKMLNDEHFKIVDYFPTSRELFPNTDIKGGVAISLFDRNKFFGKIDTFTPFTELNSILKKVVVDNEDFIPLSDIIYSQTIYRLTKKFHEDNPNAKNIISKGHENDFATILMNRFSNLFYDEKPDDNYEYIQIIGLQNNKRVQKYFRSDWVTHPIPLKKYKVLVPKSNGSGALGEVLSTPLVGSPLVGSPLVGSTETFITVGAFDSESEARACIQYIKSKFARCMLGILKVTQDNTPRTWSKVPMQDFTSESDINWSGNIDEQLYAKYKLSEEEINFIEKHVKAMN